MTAPTIDPAVAMAAAENRRAHVRAVLGGLAAVLALAMLLAASFGTGIVATIQGQETKRTRIEACSTVEDPALLALCIQNGGRR